MGAAAYGGRTLEQIRQHYEVECELADRLRNSTRQERLTLYNEVYDELMARVPHHPRLAARDSAQERERRLRNQLGLLAPFVKPDVVFLEVGSGDCLLSMAIASKVRRVYAVDVSFASSCDTSERDNLEQLITDGVNIPVTPESIDVAFSYSLMEHLHPDDAVDQLASIYKSIKPRGLYVCVTPNRLNGPHDVSKYFDDVPRGFHLKEYSVGDLKKLFLSAGFSGISVRFFAGPRSWAVPYAVARTAEVLFGLLPGRVRRRIGNRKPFKVFFQMMVVAKK